LHVSFWRWRADCAFVGAMDSHWRARSGYTIFEILLVMLIMSVLAGLTYVRLGPALERARVRGAASTLATDLQYAQVLAARYRVPVLFEVDAAVKQYQISDLSRSTVYRLRAFGASGQYGLQSFTANPATIQVFPNAIVDQSAEYTLGLNGFQRRVTFSRAGQIRVIALP
jgi:prepilin-type N-terminal cleavage/methylation domain-containing protein